MRVSYQCNGWGQGGCLVHGCTCMCLVTHVDDPQVASALAVQCARWQYSVHVGSTVCTFVYGIRECCGVFSSLCMCWFAIMCICLFEGVHLVWPMHAGDTAVSGR